MTTFTSEDREAVELAMKGKRPDRYVAIDGYWRDDLQAFQGYICAVGGQYQEGMDQSGMPYSDDEIFYWFESQEELDRFTPSAPDFADRKDTEFVITYWEEAENDSDIGFSTKYGSIPEGYFL